MFSVCLVWLVSFAELFVTNKNVDIALFGQRHQIGDLNGPRDASPLIPARDASRTTHPRYSRAMHAVTRFLRIFNPTQLFTLTASKFQLKVKLNA